MPRKPQRRRRSRKQTRSSSHRGSLRLGLVLAVLVGVNLYVFLWRDKTSIPEVMEKAAVAGTEAAAAEVEPAPAEPVAEESPDRLVEGEVQGGDSFGAILRREGLEPPQADELIRALREHMDFRTIRAGQTYRMKVAPDGTVLEFEFDVSRTTKVRAERGADGSFTADKLEASTEIHREEIGGTIESSLYMSIKNAGEDTSLVSFFVDVFAYDLNFYIDTHAGDTFRMVVEKEYLDGEFLRYGRVVAAEYSGKAGTYHAFWWHEPGQEAGKYYDADGRSIERTFLKTPLKFARISSRFNPRRMHPVLHVRRGHWGVDYAAPTGTPIWAAAPGRITYRGRRGGAGNCVIIRHDNGLQTVYMHMSKFRKGQRVGSRVRAKDVIGYVGATGLATGPHLHFGVKRNGHYIDPMKMKMTRGKGVAAKHKDQFKADTAKLVALLSEVSVEPPQPNPFIVRLTPPAEPVVMAN